MRKLVDILSILLLAMITISCNNNQKRTNSGNPDEQSVMQKEWNGKTCAVVLTYDDAIDEHLDNAIPALNERGLKGTFYLIGNAPSLKARTNDWKAAAEAGHELGNHTLNHPCDGSLSGREWVSEQQDLSKYTLSKAVEEIRQAERIISAIDGKTQRTFAYPCGDLYADGELFYDQLKDEFSGARGVSSELQALKDIDLNNISNCCMIDLNPAEEMIAKVKEAQAAGALLVFVFHGVGGGHNINVDLEAHNQLLDYLIENEKDIWVTTLNEVAQYIRKIRE